MQIVKCISLLPSVRAVDVMFDVGRCCWVLCDRGGLSYHPAMSRFILEK